MTCFSDITVYPLISNGIEGAVIRIDDVTERVRLEEIMIQTEKMMSVGGLAAGMAHEINNPLGIIMQGVQNTVRRLSPELEKNKIAAAECGVQLENLEAYLKKRNIAEYLEGVREAAVRASKIVKNMLDFSRRSDSRMAPTDINQILDEVLELAANDYDLKKKYDFRHIRIVKEYDPELRNIRCTKTEIEQVILNLVKNAAHAMTEIQEENYKPQITIKTRGEGEYAVIEVCDNGPGMDERTRKRIFEPFFTTKGIGVGTGLGLSVSYFIITTNHQGKMSVETAVGKGTTFKISLPLTREET
jgi:signal transduction histidine kinase